MADKTKDKAQDKAVPPVKRGKYPAKDNASGVPSHGGSRQGNIGHQSNQSSDNAHR